MDDTNKIIEQAFNDLSPATKFALGKIPWKARVKNIANREKLNDDKTRLLENETMMLLYSLTVPDDFSSNISEQAELDQDTSNRIAKEIFDEIILDVEKAFESFNPSRAKNLPEVLPNEKPHIVPHVEAKTASVPVAPSVPPAPPKPQDPPPPTVPKPNLASTPTYAEPSQIGPNEDKTKRPDLNFPPSSYVTGQDPYREPLE